MFSNKFDGNRVKYSLVTHALIWKWMQNNEVKPPTSSPLTPSPYSEVECGASPVNPSILIPLENFYCSLLGDTILSLWS